MLAGRVDVVKLTAIARRHAVRLTAAAVACPLFLLSATPRLTADERRALAAGLRFDISELQPADTGRAYRTVRDVHPRLRRFDAWISSVGAAVAIADIQGTGRPADLCLVDPRNDSVSILPAPGTGSRFQPFALAPVTEGYDASTIVPMGCLPADVNEDGRIDILVYYWGRTPLLYLRNSDPALAASSFVATEITASRERWYTNAALFADVDGDGHPDLLIGNYFRDGDRILDPRAVDGGEMQHSMSRAYNGGRNRLFLWKSATSSKVTFADASSALSAEMAGGWTLALGAADLNGDLLPEIYVANDFGPDRLLLNRSRPGKPSFEIVEGRRDLYTPRSKVLGRDSFKGMGVDFADVNADGRLDIAVSNISQEYALLESHFLFVHTGADTAWEKSIAPYRDESGARGTWKSAWGWDVRFADLANAGRPALLQAVGFIKGSVNRWPELQELAMANDELLKMPAVWPQFRAGDDLSGQEHDRVFVQDEAGRFHDVGREIGLQPGTISRGIAVADVYGDGKLSVAIARQWMPSLFLRNASPGAGESLVLDLRVPGALSGTRPAIGAVATVRLADGRKLVGQVDGGSGHSGKRAPEIHFGLGALPKGTLLDVELAWRDARGIHRQTRQLPAGRHSIHLVS